MRLMQCFLAVLLLTSIQAVGQQYSAGACLLLQQQIDRFANTPQNANYRSAKREYDRYCVASAEVAKPAVSVSTNIDKSEPRKPKTADVNNQVVVTTQKTLPASVEPITEPVSTIATESAVVPTELETASVVVKEDIAEPELAIAPELSATVPVDKALAENVAADTSLSDDVMILILSNIPLVAANIVALLLVVFLLTSWFGLNLPGFKGVFAEYKLNRLLRWHLSKRYQHFRKLKLFTAKDELTDIDHLVLSPFGIFVVMVKSTRGRIFGSESQANWTRQYFGTKKQFMNPLHQNFKNIEAVKHLLQLKSTDVSQHVHSVVAFSRLSQFETSMPAQISYVDAVSVYLKQFTEPCFSDEQVNRFAAVLKQASEQR